MDYHRFNIYNMQDGEKARLYEMIMERGNFEYHLGINNLWMADGKLWFKTIHLTILY